MKAMHEMPRVIAAYHANFPQIAQRDTAAGPKLVLMLQYRPCLEMDRDGYGVYSAWRGGGAARSWEEEPPGGAGGQLGRGEDGGRVLVRTEGFGDEEEERK